MTAIALTRFGGMIPRAGDQVIPEHMASFAEDCLLLSGELRGLRGRSTLADLRETVPYEIKRIYRLLGDTGYEWVTYDDASVDMVKAPLVNDQYRRFYWTQDNQPPMMNTMARYTAGQPGWTLGVPAPVATPTLVPGSATGEDITRAYVFTYVTEYNEESAPSAAVVESGKQFDDWTLTMEENPHDPAEYNILYRNVYRTVTTLQGNVEYHRVNDVDANGRSTLPVSQTVFADDKTTNEVAKNNTLESEFFSPPPNELLGLTAHPNGFLMGFHGRDLYMSVPYRPHAWPQGYILSMEDDIVGLGVFGTSVVICTLGPPYIATGINPAGMTLTQSQEANPCISDRRGIVPMPFGVYYPSDTGLMLAGPGGFQNATQNLLTKTEWRGDYTPSNLDAVSWQSQYIAFHEADQGFMFAPDEPQAAFVELGSAWPHSVIQKDHISGDVYMVKDNVVYNWNPPTALPQAYTWRSREYVTPKPVNFTTMIFEFGEARTVSDETLQEYQEFNNWRAGFPLNPLNFNCIPTVRRVEGPPALPGYVGPPPVLGQVKQPFHDSPLYKTGNFPSNQSSGVNINSGTANIETQSLPEGGFVGEIKVNIYADGVPLFPGGLSISDEEQYRLPAGYKARRWVFEFVGTINLVSFKIAETGTELGSI